MVGSRFPVQKRFWRELSARVNAKRRFETVDLVERLVPITPDQIRITNHPIERPTTAFNPSLRLTEDGFRIYARVTLGYYTYASAVAEFDVPFEDLFSRRKREYPSRLVILPSNRYDFFGVEDPRVYEVEGRLYATYCGRAVGYFDSSVQVERTLPLTAVYCGGVWKKIAVFRMPEEFRSFVVSDKNAFMVKARELFLFHRLHMLNDKFYLSVCKIPNRVLELEDHFEEIVVGDNVTVLEAMDEVESKLGWATPPLKIDGRFLVLIHAVDQKMKIYRVFATLLDETGRFTAITPFYIMEPKESYELYGDRPYVVFPCGAALKDGYIYLSYGGADSVIGLGRISLDRLLETFVEL